MIRKRGKRSRTKNSGKVLAKKTFNDEKNRDYIVQTMLSTRLYSTDNVIYAII